MNICGIICEYNPFHNGHRHLIDESRAALGADSAVVCAMSGDFVQRGEATVFLKHDRARAAVAGGADLVLELPLPWCMARAETFASGAVALLSATGVVTHLCFGSESGDLVLLRKTALALLRPEMDELIRAGLEQGNGYAAARQRALEALTGETAAALTQPNDILAVEYLKAIETQQSALTPFAVHRAGAGHDTEDEAALPSAALLRKKLRAGEDIEAYVPQTVSAALRSGAGLPDPDAIETAILSRLRCLPETAFAQAPDVSEGLEKRVFAAARTEPTLDAIVSAAATKRYPRARVRRIALSAALGLRASDSAGSPPYIRCLAANARGLKLLREMEDHAALPVLTKSAHVRRLDERAQRVFSLGAAAEDLCTLGLRDPEARRGDRDWRCGPALAEGKAHDCNRDANVL